MSKSLTGKRHTKYDRVIGTGFIGTVHIEGLRRWEFSDRFE